ncbi:MAG: TIGR01212 family radical SAM protein [Anaerostipes sp.]|jgi:radical SAM protein (TIGR01212 family)|nr:TIGR01212 family radical SAM protein [Anaerostipes sp.]MDD3744983.1 TIGR01212 family radical SAM protein [Anaerostipes sp.]
MKEKYYAFSAYLKDVFGEKVYKLPVNLPITCPNRLDGDGCSFCGEVGTGFEAMEGHTPVKVQLEGTKAHIAKRYGANKFIAYFQNYTNTFMPLDEFKRYLYEAVEVSDLVGISVSTRPDCIKKSYLDVLNEIKEKHHLKITVELGLQTVNYHTLERINRGHGLGEFIDAVLTIAQYDFDICTHVILNLPGDEQMDIVECAKVLSALPIRIVKIHSLYIPKNSKLYTEYKNGNINICTKEEYLKRLCEFLAYLREDMVVERLFSRVPKEDAVFSNWGTSWWKLRDEFEVMMEELGYQQGCKCDYLQGKALNRWGIES